MPTHGRASLCRHGTPQGFLPTQPTRGGKKLKDGSVRVQKQGSYPIFGLRLALFVFFLRHVSNKWLTLPSFVPRTGGRWRHPREVAFPRVNSGGNRPDKVFSTGRPPNTDVVVLHKLLIFNKIKHFSR